MNNFKQKGLSLIEALISTAIIGIGFIAIFQMVTFSVTSIDTSGERTKANFMSSMVAEGFIGYKDSIGGLSKEDQEKIYYVNGQAYIGEMDSPPDTETDTECFKFAEYYMQISAGNMPECSSTSTTPPESEGERNKWVEHAASDSNVGFENFPGVKIKNCSNNRVNSGEFKPIHGSDSEKYEDAPKNKVVKWVRMLGEDRSVKCKSEKDFKTVEMFELCAWSNCQVINPKIYDAAMYVGRIQINLNNGKKRKFLYFQSDYKIKQNPKETPEEGDGGPGLEGFGTEG